MDKAVVADISMRDHDRCCITGLGPSFWDPLVVAALLQPTEIQVDSVRAPSRTYQSYARIMKRLPPS